MKDSALVFNLFCGQHKEINPTSAFTPPMCKYQCVDNLSYIYLMTKNFLNLLCKITPHIPIYTSDVQEGMCRWFGLTSNYF